MRIAVVDDERSERSRLRKLIALFAEQSGRVLEVEEYSSGLDFVSDYYYPFDIIFMDVEMPLMDGLECMKTLRKMNSTAVLIFVTRLSQYAIQGYEVDAMDFMVKPVSEANLFLKLGKAIAQAERFARKVAVTHNGAVHVIPLESIYYVEGSNQYVVFHTREAELRVHTTLKKAEEKLGLGFSRCSNSFILNLSCVDRVSANDVVVKGTVLPLSRSRKKQFLNDLNRYLGGVL